MQPQRPRQRDLLATEIHLRLDPGQINQIIRRATGTDGMSQRLSRLSITAAEARTLNRRLSRSLILGLLTFAAFPDDGSYLGVADIARHLDMNISTVHRYISTLLAAGLIERHPGTRRYRLA